MVHPVTLFKQNGTNAYGDPIFEEYNLKGYLVEDIKLVVNNLGVQETSSKHYYFDSAQLAGIDKVNYAQGYNDPDKIKIIRLSKYYRPYGELDVGVMYLL